MTKLVPFATKKGLRQGDPLSPILFNIAIDMLKVLLDKAPESGLITGLTPDLVDGTFACYNMQKAPFFVSR